MLIFDLQWLLFIGLLALVTIGWVMPRLGFWLQSWLRGQALPPGLDMIGPALNQSPFGLLLLEKEYTCRYANPYARRLLNLPASRGRLPQTEWAVLLEADRLAARQDAAAPGRYRLVSLSMTPARLTTPTTNQLSNPLTSQPTIQPTDQPVNTTIRWWVAPLDGMDLVFLLDVTGQQQAEEAARTFLNNLSHELRTPLGTILTHLEVQNLTTIPAETRQQSLQLLKAEAKRMARLVNLMLELGRLETSTDIERRPVELVALVERAVAQMTPPAQERGIVVSMETDTPLPLIVGDSDRLYQVFLNLLDNAVKYCRPGDRVQLSLQREREAIRCVVQDSGPGIPAHHLPYLTRRFYRAAPQEIEGSGLGLALVEEILRRHHSHLEIESQTDGAETGTRMSFLLPVVGTTKDE